jgi:hypothetical protein
MDRGRAEFAAVLGTCNKYGSAVDQIPKLRV